MNRIDIITNTLKGQKILRIERSMEKPLASLRIEEDGPIDIILESGLVITVTSSEWGGLSVYQKQT